ncbi:MAG: hypothetical protein Q9227_000215 [Pyrenula ochraceoflavens]
MFYRAALALALSATTLSAPLSRRASSKKGLTYDSMVTNADAATSQYAGSVSWAHNWAPDPAGNVAQGVEYVPELGFQKFESSWSDAANKALGSGAKALMSYNEPEISAGGDGGSAMDVGAAVSGHQAHMNPFAGRALIGTPSVTSSQDAGKGLDYLSQWFDGCAGNCHVDFLSAHYQSTAPADFGWFKNYIGSLADFAKSKGIVDSQGNPQVWLSEFRVTGSDQDQQSFLDQAIPFLEGNNAIQRYSYYMVDNSGATIQKSAPVGNTYVATS